MSSPDGTESIVDYSGFDFAGLWKGREGVSEVERTIVGRALAATDRRRLLEVGTGFGRLLGALTALGDEVVATDLDVERLARVAVPGANGRVVRVAANLFHLPFVDGSFTGATMVRVHHHLLDPGAALAEVGRVLRPGSRLVVSYSPRPSVGTLVTDLQRALRAGPGGAFQSVTFARGPVTLPPRPFPIRAAGRREFAREALAAGFEPGAEVGSGLEEYLPVRRLPAQLLVRLGTALGRAPAFPTRFALLTKSGRSGAPLPRFPAILACPRCGSPRPGWAEGDALECDRCPFAGVRRDNLLDLRFVPPEARRWEATS